MERWGKVLRGEMFKYYRLKHNNISSMRLTFLLDKNLQITSNFMETESKLIVNSKQNRDTSPRQIGRAHV